MNRSLSIYLVNPGITLWFRGVCRSIYFHRMPQGIRIEYVRYERE
jgi:hypothetical protein